MLVVDQHGQGVNTAGPISLEKIVLDVSYTMIPKLFQYKEENTKPRGFKVAALVISAIRGTHHLLRVQSKPHEKLICYISFRSS
jgi:hypothetical protein